MKLSEVYEGVIDGICIAAIAFLVFVVVATIILAAQ